MLSSQALSSIYDLNNIHIGLSQTLSERKSEIKILGELQLVQWKNNDRIGKW